MHPNPTPPLTDLGKAFAAIIATLVAVLAEHARQSPSLAGLIALTIRRLEAMSTSFDAMVAAHQDPLAQGAARRSPHRPARPRPPLHIQTPQRRGGNPSSCRAVAMRNTAAAPRAPPSSPGHRPRPPHLPRRTAAREPYPLAHPA